MDKTYYFAHMKDINNCVEFLTILDNTFLFPSYYRKEFKAGALFLNLTLIQDCNLSLVPKDWHCFHFSSGSVI